MEHLKPFKRYIPFTSDYGFKVTFGNEHNTLFLRRALQALIQLPEPITEVFFEKNTKEGETEESRSGTYDLTCRHTNGDISIVEMQVRGHPKFVKRMEYYALMRMTPFVKKGDWKFDGIPRIFAIGILAFNLFSGEEYYRKAYIRDEHGQVLDEDLVFIFVELEKFHKSAELCLTDLDKLIFIMKEAHIIAESGNKPEFIKEDWVQSAIEELDSRRMSPEERANLEIAIAREMSNRHSAEQWEEHIRNKAKKEGREEGREESIRLIIKASDWADQKIAETLKVSLQLVQKIRQELEKK